MESWRAIFRVFLHPILRKQDAGLCRNSFFDLHEVWDMLSIDTKACASQGVLTPHQKQPNRLDPKV